MILLAFVKLIKHDYLKTLITKFAKTKSVLRLCTGDGKIVRPVEESRKAVRSTMSSTFKLMPVSSSTC